MATKRLLSFDGSYRQRRKGQPDTAQPTSIGRLDLHAFSIHALDRKSLRPQVQSLPCHESPASPLNLQSRQGKILTGIRLDKHICYVCSTDRSRPGIPLKAALCHCGPIAIVLSLTPAKIETLS